MLHEGEVGLGVCTRRLKRERLQGPPELVGNPPGSR
jgi:hypothetical protein